MRKVYAIVLATFVGLLFTKAQAQCKFQVILFNNDSLTRIVDCDFPVKQSSGNSQADSTSYSNSLNTWFSSKNYSFIRPGTTGVADFYFLISQASFDTYSEDKKDALRKYPQLYRIVQ
jgi:hypothetical protein